MTQMLANNSISFWKVRTLRGKSKQVCKNLAILTLNWVYQEHQCLFSHCNNFVCISWFNTLESSRSSENAVALSIPTTQSVITKYPLPRNPTKAP